jgi:hypothetical protein
MHYAQTVFKRIAIPFGLTLLALAAVGVAVYAFIAYTAFVPGKFVHPEMRKTYSVERAGILTHIFGSAFALLISPLQFIPAVRLRWPRMHRWVGRSYLGLGVLPGGLAGFYMAFHAFGGSVSTVGFALLAAVWLFTAYKGYVAALNKRFDQHRAWMIRNIALTLGAVTLRMQLGACFAAGLRFETFYPFLAWTSWVPNVIIAEWIIWHLARRGRASATN